MPGQDAALYRQIIRLARSGALERAWSQLESSGLAAREADPRALTLRARLKKDRARQAQGAERIRWLEQSAADYLRAGELSGEAYGLINAASLSLLAGKRDQSARLAQRVLDLVDSNPDASETRYWHGATRAEALLLLGNLPEARAALRAAVAEAPLAWEDRAATIGQFALICEETGIDAAWLDRFRPPRSLHFSGVMGIGQSDPVVEARIDDWLEAENIGFGYGALAAGADIWIAEALLRRGAGLHVVLPCPQDIFRARSVVAVDEAWGMRFDLLLAEAVSVDVLDAAPAPSPAAVDLSDAVACGMAIHNARLLQSEALRLRIAGKGDDPANKSVCGSLRSHLLEVARLEHCPDFHVADHGENRALLKLAGNGAPRLFAHPGAAWDAARDALAEGGAAALDYRFLASAEAGAEERTRIDAMAELGGVGQAIASKAFGFALLAMRPDLRLDALGDVRTPSGFMPLYTLR